SPVRSWGIFTGVPILGPLIGEERSGRSLVAVKGVMKKFFVICGLALALSAVSQQQASAWHKFCFSVGLNVSWEAANNSYFCGRIISGPAPYAYAPYDVGFGAPAFPGHGFDGHYAAAPAAQVAPQAVAQPAGQPAAQG